MVVVGADHRGVLLRARILEKLDSEEKYSYSDLGGIDPNIEDDYTDVALAVAKKVIQDKNNRGILICGSGAGVDMIANKIPGIRCALVFDVARAKQAREHEDVNVIALPSDVLDEKIALEIVDTFLETPFSNEKRHVRRLKKMSLIDQFGSLPQVIPAILAKTEREYSEDLDKLSPEGWSKFEWIHIDFMDNHFVHNKTIPPEVIEGFRKTVSQKREAHLMVDYPKEWIKDLIFAGIDRIILHVEIAENLDSDINYIREYAPHVEIGIALNPETDIVNIFPYLSKVDLILVMSVHPGFSGQEFIKESLDKIKALKKICKSIPVSIDGGINPNNISEVCRAGASNIVIGSHLMEGDILENLKLLEEKIYLD